MKSWKTTTLGILTGALIIGGEVRDALDDDPLTVFEFDKVMLGLSGLGLGWFARDNSVSSEQAGAK